MERGIGSVKCEERGFWISMCKNWDGYTWGGMVYGKLWEDRGED